MVEKENRDMQGHFISNHHAGTWLVGWMLDAAWCVEMAA